MTGAQLPLYVILHVIVMTSYSCTAPEADRFAAQLVFPPTLVNNVSVMQILYFR